MANDANDIVAAIVASYNDRDTAVALLRGLRDRTLLADVYDLLSGQALTAGFSGGADDRARQLFLSDLCVYLAAQLGDGVKQFCSSVNRGFARMNAGYIREAEEDLSEAVSRAARVGIDPGSDCAYDDMRSSYLLQLHALAFGLGQAALKDWRRDDASAHFRQARGFIGRASPRGPDGAGMYFKIIADDHECLGEYEAAIGCYEKALASPEFPGVLRFGVLDSMGKCHEALGHYRDAERCYLRERDEAAREGNPMAESRSCLSLASVYFLKLDEFEKADHMCDVVIAMTAESSEKCCALDVKAGVRIARGHYAGALECTREMAELAEAIGDTDGGISARFSIANSLSLMGKPDEAIDTVRHILDILEQDATMSDPLKKRTRARALQELASLRWQMGQYEEAITLLHDSNGLCSGPGTDEMLAANANIEGYVLSDLNAYDDAYRCFNEIYSSYCAREADISPYQVMKALEGLAWVEMKKGDPAGARDIAQEAVDECDARTAMHSQKPDALKMLAELQAAQRDYGGMIQTALEVVAIYGGLGMHRAEAEAYSNLSQLLINAHRFDDALIYLDKARSIFGEIGLPDMVLMVDSIRAQAHLFSGRVSEAKKMLLDLTSCAEFEKASLSYQGSCLIGLGAIYRNQGDLENANKYFVTALGRLDMARASIKSGDLKVQFREREESLYDAVVLNSLLLGDIAGSCEFAERSRSRVLAEQMGASRLRRPGQMSEQMQAVENALIDDMNVLAKTDWREMSNSLRARVRELDDSLDRLWASMLQGHPDSLEIQEYVSMRKGEPVTAPGMIEAIGATGSSTLVEYYLLKDELLIYLIDAGSRDLQCRRVGVEKRELERLCKDVADFVTRGDSRGEADDALAKAGSYLIDPVAGALKRSKHVVFVPHGFLNNVPLHALPSGDGAVIDRHTVSYSPGVSVLRYSMARSSPPGAGALVVGNPSGDLPFAEAEARAIARLTGSGALLCGSANLASVRDRLGSSGVVAFSCHASFMGGRHALDSLIMLSNGQRLTARDILRLSIPAELVTLSACESAVSEEMPGSEMIGLVRSLLFAGAKSVVASLWPVSDLSAFLTMTRFYENYRSRGMGKAASLRDAQLYVKNATQDDVSDACRDNIWLLGQVPCGSDDRPFDHPFHWAPFVLIGDPR